MGGLLLQATGAVTGGDTTAMTWLLVKMVLILAVVCGTAWVLLKFGLPRLVRGRLSRHRLFSVEGRFDLDPKKQLWVVRVGTRRFLLGSGDSQVNCLAELQEGDLRAEGEA